MQGELPGYSYRTVHTLYRAEAHSPFLGCHRSHICGVFERSSLWFTARCFWVLDHDHRKKMGHSEVTNGSSENDARNLRLVTRTQCFHCWFYGHFSKLTSGVSAYISWHFKSKASLNKDLSIFKVLSNLLKYCTYRIHEIYYNIINSVLLNI